jgi:hypothetical protein
MGGSPENKGREDQRFDKKEQRELTEASRPLRRREKIIRKTRRISGV